MELFNTWNWLDNYRDAEFYDYYKDECEMNRITPGAMDSDEFMQYCIEYDWRDVEDFYYNLRGTDTDSGKWIVSGRLGLWNGRPAVYDIFDSLTEAVEACSKGVDDISAEYDSKASEIDFTGYHHDGRNYFTIRKLSALGADAVDDMETFSFDNPTNFAKLPEYLY